MSTIEMGAGTIARLPGSGEAAGDRLATAYTQVRSFTESLVEGLAPEDMVVQSMPDVSPTKWHLAHTSWFFEQFVLVEHLPGYTPFSETYLYLFNSYYHQAGERHCRDQRGYISRPTVAEVMEYRRHVDGAIHTLLETADLTSREVVESLVTLGLHHEQQHQELLLTDIKHVFSVNPLRPVYRAAAAPRPGGKAEPLRWIAFDGGLHEIGHDGEGFAYDNEGPRYRHFLEPFEIADRLVTCGEYVAFIRDGGYRRPELWLSMGWAAVQEQEWSEPFYWERSGDGFTIFTLSGMKPLDADEPVCHLSYFEADAYARWAGARLPTEAEWEVAAADVPIDGNLAGSGRFHPSPAGADGGAGAARQMYGDVWEWTSSQYSPYPGYRPAPGAVGEYNGKFMCNQFVLRGASCATSRSHIRPTYRNFFPPEATWQFTGLRLARGSEARRTP